MARSTSSITVFFLTLFTITAFAQKNAPQDDNTNSPVAQQQMQEHARERAQRSQGAQGHDLGIEEDDPTARLEWQRHAFGVHTQQSKRQLLQQRAAQTAARASGVKTPARGSVDFSTMKFSAELPQAGSNPTDPAWISVGPADAEYEQNGAASAKARDSGRARKILPHPTDAETLYFLTSGGGLWVTHNFSSNPPT